MHTKDTLKLQKRYAGFTNSTFKCNSSPFNSRWASFDSQPIRQRSDLKHSHNEQRHPPHLLLHSIHTSAVSSHFLLPPLATLSHLTARLSLSYNLSALPMHHSSDQDFIRRYRLFFSTWFFFFFFINRYPAPLSFFQVPHLLDLR